MFCMGVCYCRMDNIRTQRPDMRAWSYSNSQLEEEQKLEKDF